MNLAGPVRSSDLITNAPSPLLAKFAGTLVRYRKGILAYDDGRISSGPLAATNNKSKTRQRQTLGIRDQEFFKLTILAIHEARHALVG
jgi:transposase